MEQRRVLLIITGVAVALAITLGLGLWLLYPREDAVQSSEETAGGVLEWEPRDYLLGDGSLPGIEETPETGFTGLDSSGDDQPFVTVAPSEDTDAEPTGPSDRSRMNEEMPGFTGTVTREPVMATDPADASDATAAEPDIRSVRSASPDAGASADPRGAGPAVSPAQSSRSGSAEPRSESSPAPLSDRAYWIQVISSPNRDTVEQARITLDELQLGSRILTKEIGGRIYYRLRLGPFPIRTEAEKFLGWVHDVDGFADALIFVDYTTVVLAANSH